MVSNKFLAFVIMLSIFFSVSSTFLLMNQLNKIAISTYPTAKATEMGRINLSVQNSISIALLNSVIDFGVGFINSSCDEINLNGKTFANLTAGLTFIDNTDCWTGNTTPTSFIIENNGNVNVSVSVRGPSAKSFFNNYNGALGYNLTVVARENEANSCATGLYTWPWVELSENVTLCQRLKYYPDTEDSIAVDVNVLIPVDLPAGTYENSTIEFYTTQV
ncbi:MAG: hypothetical protein QXE31_03240 [Candidatus Woesearchaeota archaeon]